MVINFLKSGGLKCQASGFSLLIDPEVRRLTEGESEEQTKLILKTEATLPLHFPFSQEVIATPGEYEVGGLKVKGVSIEKERDRSQLRTVYLVKMDEVNLCFVGGLRSELSDEVLDRLEEVNILFLPVGAPYLSPKSAAALIRQLEPAFVVVTHDKDLSQLAREFGQKPIAQDKLTVRNKDLEAENKKIVWLTAKS